MGFNKLYKVIYDAHSVQEESFFIGLVTGTEPVEITAFDLPLPSFQICRALPTLEVGDEVLGVFIKEEAYIFAVV